MNKLLRMFCLFLVVSLLMTSLPVNALATDAETVPAAEDVFESEAILSDELIPVGLPEEEVFAAPIQEAIIEEESEMDLMQAMGLTAEGEPTPEPENTEEPGITPEPEETDEPDGEEMPETGIEPETSEEPGADLLPEITGEPELFPEGEAEEVPVEPEMSVLPGVVYTIGGAGEIAVALPETAMPVVEVEGLVCDGDYYVNDTGVVLTTAWLDTLAPGEVLVCILGADGVLYVQPVVAVEMVINNTEVDYDIVNLRVNGEDLFAGSGTNWTYDAETGVLTLTGESTVSGSGVVQSVDVATDAAITLSSLELTIGNAAAFTCNTLENSAVNLVLTGENTVAAANLTSAELIVSGEGSLNTDNITCAGFTWAAGTLNVKTLTQTGMLAVNAGTVNVSGNGTSAIIANDMTIAAGAQVIVKAAPSVEAFTAVQVANKITNSGTLDVDILSGAATEVYGVKAKTYSGDADVLKVVNNQPHKGKNVYGVYASGNFHSAGSYTFVNNQPVEKVTGVFSCYSMSVYDFDAKTNAEATVYFRGVYSYAEVKTLAHGTVCISMDNAVGPEGGERNPNSVGLYGEDVILYGAVTITGENAANVCGVFAEDGVDGRGKISVDFSGCTGIVRGMMGVNCVTFNTNNKTRINIDGGNRIDGVNAYIVYSEKYSQADITVRNAISEGYGIYDRSRSQTSIWGTVKIRVYGESDVCLGIYGNLRIVNKEADISIYAPAIGLSSCKVVDDTEKGRKRPMVGFLFEYKNGQLEFHTEYMMLEVDGKGYSFYPGLRGASGDGWKYDETTDTLTLIDFSGSSIRCPEIDVLNVALFGTNSLGVFDSCAGKTVFSGSGTLNVDGTGVDGLGGIFANGLSLKSGIYSFENCDCAIWGERVEIEGADIVINNAQVGIRSAKVLSVGKDVVLDIVAGYRALLSPEGYTLNGQMHSETNSILKIKDGIVVEATDSKLLSIDGRNFLDEDLQKNQSGENWVWDAKEQVLTLDTYRGKISYNGGKLHVEVVNSAMLTSLYADEMFIVGADDAKVVVSALDTKELSIENVTVVVSEAKSLSANNLIIKSGSLTSGGIHAVEGVQISGGQIVCDSICAQTVSVSGGTVVACADISAEVGTIQITGGQVITAGTVKCTDYIQTGGEAEIGTNALMLYNRVDSLVQSQKVRVAGGSFKAANLSGRHVFECMDIAIEEKASAVLYAAERIANAEEMSVSGVKKALDQIKVFRMENGVCDVFAESQDYGLALYYDLKSFKAPHVLVENFVIGDSVWVWDNRSNTLELGGFEGLNIIFAGLDKANIHLIPGTVNTVENYMSLQKTDLLVSGSGVLQSNIISGSANVTFDGCGAYIGNLDIEGGDIEFNNSRMIDGKLDTNNGSISIFDSNVMCMNVYARNNLNIRNSMVEGLTCLNGNEGYDIRCGQKATIKSSILMYAKYKAGSTSLDKYSARFMWKKNGYTLQKSAAFNKSWTLPDRPFYIPAGTTLKINSGKTLYYMGSLKKAGKVSGKTKAMGVPNSLAISGRSTMAIGTSQQLKLTSNPAYANKEVLWMTDFPGYCDVDNKGNITIDNNPLLIGQTITVAASSIMAENCYATFEIGIYAATSELTIMADAEKADELELWLDPANKTAQLTAKVRPSDASREVTWKSTKSKVASVSADGVVTAKAAGTAYIYAVAADGTGVESQRVKVTVKKAPTSVKFTSSSATLGYDAEEGVGSSKQLKVKLSSGSASTITYKSSNAEVVTVDENGVITAKKAGKATITATTYNKKKATCKVTVKGAPDSIEINKAEHVMGLGDEYTFTAKIPSGSYGNWTFSSSDAAKVSVDAQTGAAKAEALGEAVITATSFNGKTDSCKVTVVPAPDGIKAPENLTLGKGETRYLNAEPTLTGDQTTATTFTYSTSNKKVVTVDANGKLRAMATGKAVITIMTHNEVTATCEVVVKKAPTSIKLSHKKGVLAHDEKLNLGTAYQLTAKLSSGSASEIKFTSSNTKVAKVDENGLITTVGVGTAKIKATTFNKKYATCTVTVMPAPENMIFGKDSYVVAVDDKITVEAEAEFGTYSPTVEYSSGDLFVAMVDKDTGLVTPTDIGTTTLTATGFNGAVGTAEIKVVNSPDTLALNAYKGTLKVGKKFTIVPTVTRTDLKETTATYTFRSNRPSVCTVSASGKLVGRKKGTAVITVRTHNGLEATVRVTVK